MHSLLNFDNVMFTGKLAGMPTVFTHYSDPDYIPSRFYESKFKNGQGARTQDVIYDVLRMYKDTFPITSSVNNVALVVIVKLKSLPSNIFLA